MVSDPIYAGITTYGALLDGVPGEAIRTDRIVRQRQRR